MALLSNDGRSFGPNNSICDPTRPSRAVLVAVGPLDLQNKFKT